MKKEYLDLSDKQSKLQNPDNERNFYVVYWHNDVKNHIGKIINPIQEELEKLKKKDTPITKESKRLLNKILKNIKLEIGNKLI